jgi:TRAP-type C4-dicarboxylate transport system permease small subunit
MEKAKALYKTFSCSLAKALELLSAAIIGVTTLVICAEVITRSLFGWTYGVFEEGPRLFFCYAVLPMLGVIYKRGRHISVETLSEKLKGRRKIFLMLGIDVAMVAGSIILLMAGISGTQTLYASGMRVVGVLDLPEFLFILSIPVGGGILLLYSIEAMVSNVVSLSASGNACANSNPQSAGSQQPLL